MSGEQVVSERGVREEGVVSERGEWGVGKERGEREREREREVIEW